MKVLFVYPRFQRHAEAHPELLEFVPMNEYLGSPSLGIAALISMTPPEWEIEFRDDRLEDAAAPTDADLVALSFFTAAARRGLELADYFRASGKKVVAGGIFSTMMPDVVAAHVDSVVLGEGELLWRQVLSDVISNTMRPRYSNTDPVDLDGLPVPDLSYYFSLECDRFQPDDYPLQLSRGCRLSCHACVLPTSMTRNPRTFSIDHAMGQLDQLAASGKRACLTEDTSWFPGAAHRNHLVSFFDRLIETGRTASVSYVGISMPMILMTPERVFAKAKKAGVNMFYLVGGFDPITMKAFTGENPRAWQRGLDAIQKAWDVGIEPYTSFLIGGDQDDEGTWERMIEFANVSKIRKAEFAIATPYPGTPQWNQLVKQERILTTDWSKYNDANVVFRPKKMTVDQLNNSYISLWREFYRPRMHLGELSQIERTIQF